MQFGLEGEAAGDGHPGCGALGGCAEGARGGCGGVAEDGAEGGEEGHGG